MTKTPLPPYAPKALVAERLPLIFPEGTPNRNYCTRDLAASTIFTMLYIGAIEGGDTYLGPKHVYLMTDAIASQSGGEARRTYAADAMKPGYRPPGTRWYADNTREPIRDETLREGLVAIGAAFSRNDLPTTSSKPRYTLKADLAALFDPDLIGDGLDQRMADWRKQNLNKEVLARITIQHHGATASKEEILVTFPNQDRHRMAPGLSSVISKAVIEDFATRFLAAPAVLWLSESGNKVVARHERTATAIGLHIEADKNLPDIILVDLAGDKPLLVFVEVVATDGPMTERRRDALHALTDRAGFDRRHVAFVTAYADRDTAAFKKTVPSLAWGSFAWFMSEPGKLIGLHAATNALDLRALLVGNRA